MCDDERTLSFKSFFNDLRILKFLFGLILSSCLSISTSQAQSTNVGQISSRSIDSGNNEELRILNVREKQVDLRNRYDEFNRAQALLQEGIISQEEYDKSRRSLEVAQLSYQSAVLSLLDRESKIQILKAVKKTRADGRQYISLAIKNSSSSLDDSRLSLLSDFDGAVDIPDQLRNQTIRSAFISILKKDNGAAGTVGTSIALPYEAKLTNLPSGAVKYLEFDLLQDTNEVIVKVTIGEKESLLGIQLEQDASADKSELVSTQISRTADLGTQIDYQLKLKRNSLSETSYKLYIRGLPKSVIADFIDPSSSARLSQIILPAGTLEEDILLRLSLPDRTGTNFQIDEAHRFFAIAIPDDEQIPSTENIDDLLVELNKSRTGYRELQITPRGVGRISIALPSLFEKTLAGNTIETPLTVRNLGSRKLEGVRLSAEPPLGWEVTFTPNDVDTLLSDSEEIVDFQINVPSNAPPGEYEIRLKTTSNAYGRPIDAEDKTMRIRIDPNNNSTWPLLFAVFLLVLIIMFITISTRMRRR